MTRENCVFVSKVTSSKVSKPCPFFNLRLALRIGFFSSFSLKEKGFLSTYGAGGTCGGFGRPPPCGGRGMLPGGAGARLTEGEGCPGLKPALPPGRGLKPAGAGPTLAPPGPPGIRVPGACGAMPGRGIPRAGIPCGGPGRGPRRPFGGDGSGLLPAELGRPGGRGPPGRAGPCDGRRAGGKLFNDPRAEPPGRCWLGGKNTGAFFGASKGLLTEDRFGGPRGACTLGLGVDRV